MITPPEPDHLLYLEILLDELCQPLPEECQSETPRNGVMTIRYRGMCEETNTQRPMFELFPDGQVGGIVRIQHPCPACDDFARSWNCPEHSLKERYPVRARHLFFADALTREA